MRVTFNRCDRCGAQTTERPFQRPPFQLQMGPGKVIDLCNDCKQAFANFMAGEDEVGAYVLEEVREPGECHHHVPCADPDAHATWVTKRCKRRVSQARENARKLAEFGS